MKGRCDAGIGLRASDHQRPDIKPGEYGIEFGGLEGVAVGLVHDRFGVGDRKLGNELPGRRAVFELVVAVHDPHDRRIGSTRPIHKRRDVGDDLVAANRWLHHPDLHIDDEQSGSRSVGGNRHGGILRGRSVGCRA